MAELPFLAGEQSRGPLLVILFFISATVIIVWGIWEGSFPLSDEVITAETAREVIVTGDWWTLHFDGQPRYGIPPAGIWLMAASFTVFGQSEFASRLVFALVAVVTLYVVYRIGRLSVGTDEPARMWRTHEKAVGLLSAIVLASSPLFGRLAPHVNLNTLFAFFVALSVLGWLLLPQRKAAPVLWAAALAGGILSGGAGGLLLVPAALLASVRDRERRVQWRRPAFLAATGAALIVGCLWLVSVTVRAPRGAGSGELWAALTGFATAARWSAANLLRALGEAWLKGLPWSIPAAAAYLRVVLPRRAVPARRETLTPDVALIVFSVVLFASSALGRPGDTEALLPIVPLSAVLAAREMGRWIAARAGKNGRREEVYVSGLWSFNQAMTAIFCLLMLLLVATPLSLHTVSNEPIRDVARMAARITPPGARLGNYKQRYDVQAAMLLFYGARSIDRPSESPGEMARVLEQRPDAVVLSSAADLNDLRGSPHFPYNIHIIYRSGDLVLFGLGAKHVPGEASPGSGR